MTGTTRQNLRGKAYIAIGVVLCASAGQAAIEKVFTSDGVIQTGDIYDKVEVRDTKPLHTTVNMTGGMIWDPGDPQGGMFTYDSSTVNILDGLVLVLHTYNSSTVNVRGGSIGRDASGAGTVVTAKDSSVINVYEGGRVAGGTGGACELYDLSTMNVYGGGLSPFLFAQDYSVVAIYDGFVSHITASDRSTVNIRGGYIGSSLGGFFCSPSATVNIYGYDFEYNPKWRWSDDLIYGPRWVSKLTGRGFDGTPIEITGIADPSKYPNIHLIPEPTTFLLLGLGGLALLRIRGRDYGGFRTRCPVEPARLYHTDALCSSSPSLNPLSQSACPLHLCRLG